MKSRAIALMATTLAMAVASLSAQPDIETQPANQVVLAGSTATFSVAVSGSGPFTFQWSFNGTNLPNDIITTIAGTGTNAYSGDGGPATNAGVVNPTGFAWDNIGNLLISDGIVVRKMDTNGIITTVAGNGTAYGYSGDGGPATNASMTLISGVALDRLGNLFIADTYNNRIRKVDTNGIIRTVAGNGSTGFSGDGGAATNARLNWPSQIVVESSGNLLIADTWNSRVRQVDTNGIILTVAGSSRTGGGGNGGAATNADIGMPTALALDGSGNLFIVDQSYGRVLKVDTNGIVVTVAGHTTFGPFGDGGPATNAFLAHPYGLALANNGEMFIADSSHYRVRKVDTNGIIMTVAGSGFWGEGGYSGDGGSATNARLNYPWGLALDGSGNLFIADFENRRVRKVGFGGSPTFVISTATTNDTGDYRVVIASPGSGSVTSTLARLTVALPPNIQSFGRTNDVLSFTWTTVSNLHYQVRYTTDLASTNWIALGNPVIATSGTASASDFIGPDDERFYRIELLLSP